MSVLVIGLALFLGVHAFTMFRAPRERLVARLGDNAYRGLYSVVSLAGFSMIAWGFSIYRRTAWTWVWIPPVWTKHLALVLTLPVFVLLAAAPGRIRTAVKHPMLLAVKIRATAHLLANGDLGGMLLSGGFLAWAVAARISLKRRVYTPTKMDLRPSHPRNDVVAIVVGLTLWFVFVRWLHPILIGVVVWPGHS